MLKIGRLSLGYDLDFRYWAFGVGMGFWEPNSWTFYIVIAIGPLDLFFGVA